MENKIRACDTIKCKFTRIIIDIGIKSKIQTDVIQSNAK